MPSSATKQARSCSCGNWQADTSALAQISCTRYFQAVPELWRLLQERYQSLIQMKPLLVLVTAIASGTSLSVLAQHPGFADAGRVQAPFLLASAPATQSRIWVKVSTQSTLKGIAEDLGYSSSDLIALNDQSSFESIQAGSWVALPSDAEEDLKTHLALTQQPFSTAHRSNLLLFRHPLFASKRTNHFQRFLEIKASA